MTNDVQQEAIDILTENFRGKKMLPKNQKVKDFVAGPQFKDALPEFMMSYFKTKGDKDELSKLVAKEKGWIIYAVLDSSDSNEFIPHNLSFVPSPEFLQANDIDLPSLLHQKVHKKADQ